MANVFSLENEVFRSFAFYATLVLVKTLSMSHLTSFWRLTKAVFGNPEDTKQLAPEKGKTSYVDRDVERARRGHLNDLENIPIFVLLGLFYIATGPTPSVALWHFRIFAVARITHTVAQQMLQVLPPRTLAYTVGQVVCSSMAVQILMATFS